jgi:polyphosphate kinase
MGEDATELFNYLTTGYTPKRNYRKLVPAPKILKKELLRRIEREISSHKAENAGRIQFKMNALEDAGIPGLSENVRVVSILGRFLEHSRIYYFRNGGEEEYFIGSADAMQRNLENRVEVLVPVEDPLIRKDLRDILDTQLSDCRGAWELRPDGSYFRLQPPKEGEARSSQEILIELAEKRNRDVSRLKKRKSKHFGQRNIR